MKKLLFSTFLISTTVFSSDTFFIKLADQLDEDDYYCLDITGSTLPGSAVLVRECDESKSQNFGILPSGQIEFNNSGLCVAAGDVSQKASGPSHLWRVANLQSCKNTDSKLTTWTTK